MFDSRGGGPHLHTHVVISNKVQPVLDGKWRSLDGRPMHATVVALSEMHESVFANALTRSLGVQWELRERGRDRHPALLISTVSALSRASSALCQMILYRPSKVANSSSDAP